jgi:hypothetical protein
MHLQPYIRRNFSPDARTGHSSSKYFDYYNHTYTLGVFCLLVAANTVDKRHTYDRQADRHTGSRHAVVRQHVGVRREVTGNTGDAADRQQQGVTGR